MTTTIALAGKGGVGKTTIAALLIKYLVQKQRGAILAIDADPSSNLNMVLGLELEWTVGDIREGLLDEVKQSLTQGGAAMGTVAGGATKQEYLDYQIRSALAEGDQIDLIAMGQPEGQGCYCAVNHNLREVIDAISRTYRYVVIDNEAGMEHLSRRTTRDVQYLLVVTDPTQRGLVAAQRIAAFRRELDIHIEQTGLIINRLRGDMPPALQAAIDELDIPLLGTVPSSDTLYEFELSGQPLVTLTAESPVYTAVATIAQELLET
jgi:CO dehydrogenase maturation factor